MNSRPTASIILRTNSKLWIVIMSTLALALVLFAPRISVAAKEVIASPISSNGCPATLDFKLRRLAETGEVNLCESYKGKVLLIVNTASKCGFTDQFDGLEKLYKKYKDKGLVVLGFPSNDFANQDPENEKKIADFCRLTYGVEFPMFEKTHAAEKQASPLYKTLGELAGEYPKWNFHKYLLDTNGNLIGSFPSQVKPFGDQLVTLLEQHLPKN